MYITNPTMIQYLFYMSLFLFCTCSKYSKEKNSPDYQKLLSLDKPFRIQKLNLVWEKATKKIAPEKLKALYTDLKFQDKDEIEWKTQKTKGLDKNGLKEAVIERSFNAILLKYNLADDFKSIQETVIESVATTMKDSHVKSVFKDKKLNKLWMKAQDQGFSDDELNTLKEEFLHHQNKIDQYYDVINQLHKTEDKENYGNTVEHILHAEEGEKLWKSDNPHQILKEKHSELKAGYDYLNSKIIPRMKNMEFEEPQVNALWEMAKNGSFTPEELESLKNELHHFEHRIKKYKVLTSMEADGDNDVFDESKMKKQKRLKEYNYKIEKVQKHLTSRILQKHTEL